MVVKIMKAAKSFAGISYSEKKCEQGKAVLTTVQNFDDCKKDKEALLEYMNCLSKLNSKAKNKQFHAVISCKNREYSAQELTEIGKQWLQDMGYGEQPYLIYFHSDSANNHIHIISSRIKKDGKVIPAYMEGKRGVNLLNKIMKQNLAIDAEKDIQRVLTGYNFSTLAQFRLVCEKLGWKTTNKEGSVQLIKNGNVQSSINNSQVEEKIRAFSIDTERTKKIAALMIKYSQATTKETFVNLMHEKFGFDVIFHTNKGHEQPYGYTIIDNKTKSVYKGSEILLLNKLLNNFDNQQFKDNLQNLVSLFTRNNISFFKLRELLKEQGYILSDNGSIRRMSKLGVIMKLETSIYKQLKYEDRRIEIDGFKCCSNNESAAKAVLARLFFVKADDFSIIGQSENERQKYADFIAGIVANRCDLISVCEQRGFEIITGNNRAFILDRCNRCLYDISDVRGIDRQTGQINTDVLDRHPNLRVIECSKFLSSQFFNLLRGYYGSSGVFASISHDGSSSGGRRRKRKRHEDENDN